MIELKPRKEFAITLENGQSISGKFGTWALKRFGMKKNYSLAQLNAALSSFTLDDAIEFILSAVEQSFRELKTKDSFPYSDIDVCAWVDELGGIGSGEVQKLFKHAGDEQKKTEGEVV